MASSPGSATSTPSTATTTSPDPLPAALAPAGAGAVLAIDLDAVAANWRLLAARVAPAACAAVVKADAYGLGAARVAPVLRAAGCATFFVAHLDEGIALRRRLPEAAIGVLNGLLPGTEAEFRQHRLIPVLNQLSEIRRWQQAVRDGTDGRRSEAFIHLDTGMNRLGLAPDELERLAATPELLDGITVRAWISHLACADDWTSPVTAAQHERFLAALARLPRAPASLANSSGIFRGRAYHFDLVRPGCALYGVNPAPEARNPMHPAVRLAGRVLQVRHVDSPMTVGYGAAHRVTRRGRIATIAVGYADGYARALGATGMIGTVAGTAPVVGRVSMDLITADVTDLPEAAVAPGTLVDLIGPHRDVDQVAREAGTIGYEVLTSLGRRYARLYREGGRWGF